LVEGHPRLYHGAPSFTTINLDHPTDGRNPFAHEAQPLPSSQFSPKSATIVFDTQRSGTVVSCDADSHFFRAGVTRNIRECLL
jgi:hypothetical protein